MICDWIIVDIKIQGNVVSEARDMHNIPEEEEMWSRQESLGSAQGC